MGGRSDIGREWCIWSGVGGVTVACAAITNTECPL